MSPPFHSPQIAGSPPTNPLFEPFFQKRPRGRPRSGSINITQVDDPGIAWAHSYRLRLKAIHADPLAWLVQIYLRRSWVSRWNFLVRSSTRDAFHDYFTDPRSWFNRFVRMLSDRPIMTVALLHTHGFLTSDFEDLHAFYTPAAEVYFDATVAKIWRFDERFKPSWKCHIFEAPFFAPRTQVCDGFHKWVEEHYPAHSSVNFDDLQILGVLEWIDLRIFELTTGRVVKDSVKLAIINAALPQPSEIRLSRVKLDGERDTLDTTRTKAIDLLTGDAALLARPLERARTELVNIWEHTDGRGDQRFVPRLNEVPTRYNLHWKMCDQNREKERADLETLIQNFRSARPVNIFQGSRKSR